MNITLSNRQKMILRWVGFPVLAIASFLFTVSHTFPYPRLIDKVEASMAGKADLEVVTIKPGLVPGKVILDGVTLKILPKDETQKPVTIFVDRLVINVGLLPALVGRLSVDVEAHLGGGVLYASLYSKKSGWGLRGKTEEFPLAMLPPGVHQAFGGLPLAGGLTAEFEIGVPGNDLQKTNGYGKASCKGCTVGDGKTKIQNQPMPGQSIQQMAFAEGPTVPRLSLGTVALDLKIRNGKGKLLLNAQSDDGALKIDWDVDLVNPLAMSKVSGCLRFKLAEALRSRAPTFVNFQISLTANREADGMYALPMARISTLGNFRMNNREQCAGGTVGSGGIPPRPSLPGAAAPPMMPRPSTPIRPVQMRPPVENQEPTPSPPTEMPPPPPVPVPAPQQVPSPEANYERPNPEEDPEEARRRGEMPPPPMPAPGNSE